MSELFEMPEATELTEGKRSIPGATILKAYATQLAAEIMAKIPTADAEFIQKVKETQESTTALDAFVKEQCGAKLNNADVATFGEEEVHKLLKSNQSNRSRRKNMSMTQSNYVEMLTAAVAEWVIRESCDIKKSAGGFGAGRQALVINEETVAELAKDQDALGRAIRNIQSKKSTFKSNHKDEPGWESTPEYQGYLEQEAMLKAVRTTQPAGRKGMSIKKALQFIFDGVGETDSLGKDESHAVIEACRNLSKGAYPEGYVDLVAAQQVAKAEDNDDVYAEDIDAKA